MSEEHSFDLRIAHSSPLFTASPLTGNRTTGWSTLCTGAGYLCDAAGQTAVYTTLANASMELQFWGSRIELRGNMTGGMSLEWELDGASRAADAQSVSKEGSTIVGEPLGSGVLAVFEGLDSTKAHSIRMITRPTLPSGVLAFEGALVTVGTGVTGGTMSMTYLDDTHPMLQYSQTPGGWAQYNDYDSPVYNLTYPEGVTNRSFHCSKEPGEHVSMNFNGTQVLLFGPCYASNGAYDVYIDNQAPVRYNASTNAYSAPRIESVAGACLRYISPPLSPDTLHYVSMANADENRETNLDWVLIVGNSGGQSISAGERKKGSNVAAIAGAVAGSVALLIALAVLWFVLHRRRRQVKRVVPHTTSPNSPDEQKVASVDLLATDTNIPRLLDGERRASVLTSPSHGTQSNTMSYRRVEPFELPPLVPGDVDRKTGSRAEPAPSSASSTVPTPPVLVTDTPNSVASSPPPPAPLVGSVEAGAVPISGIPAPAPQISHPSVSHDAQPSVAQPPVTVLPHDNAQQASHARQVSQAQAVQSLPSQASSAAVPDLSQISSDVNRILAQLGQIRRRGDSGSNGRRGYTGEGYDEDAPGEAPPEYGKHRRVLAREESL